MEAAKISRLRDEQEKAFAETQEQVNKFEKFRSDYKALQTRLRTLPEELSHDVMVPFGKLAFMPGKIVKTNEILVLLGDNWFAERSAKQAREIAGRRIAELDKRIQSLKEQQNLLGSRLGFTSELQDMAEGKGDCKEIIEEYDEEKERLWDEQHKKNVRRYHEKLKKEKNTSISMNEQGENNAVSNCVDEDNVWARLEALEKQENERGELESSFDDSDDERGQLSTKLDTSPQLNMSSESSLQHKRVVWEDEGAKRKDESETAEYSEDSDDDDEYEEEDDDDDEKRKSCIKTINFSHTQTSEPVPTKRDMDSSTITSPAEIYKLFCPKPILKNTGSGDSYSLQNRNSGTKGQTSGLLPDATGDGNKKVFFPSDMDSQVIEPKTKCKSLSDTTSRDKAFSGVVMENPVTDHVPSSSSSSQPQPSTTRVSKFKAQRMGQNPS